MMHKKLIILGLSILFLAAAISMICAADVNYCCEKTINGAWCDNRPQAECDANYKIAPTSCDSTSYCKQGCCFDSIEGLCMESTPQRVCSDSNGTWASDSKCDIPQCRLGCCILGDQGAFVTLTRCKQLSGFYGLITDFRRNILDEVTCIATAQGEDRGACVYEDPETLTKTCTFTTRTNCKGAVLASVNETNITGGVKAFYKDILCSAEELGTTCGPSTKTMLIDGKDEVYFQDTCGQPANIYDASRYNDKQYWKNVYKKSESCGYGSSNAGSKTCGNCDYYLGSIGKKATLATGSPTYGNFICVDLSCKAQGKKHGESWCVTDSPTGNGQDTVGSRYFKEVCLNNEVLTEACDDYRGQICIQDSFNGFSEAACRVNRWQDCSQQLESDDCENKDARDCKWIDGYYFSSSTQQIEKSNNDTDKGALTPTGLCVPYYPPGFAFWSSGTTSATPATGTTATATTPTFNATTPAFGTGYVNPTTAGTSASTQCSMGNSKLTIHFKKVQRIWPYKSEDWKCDTDYGNCQYLTAEDEAGAAISDASAQNWASEMNNICYQLGDCGGYINWLGVGTEDGYAAYSNGKRVAGMGGAEILEQAKTTTAAGQTASTTNFSSGTTPSFTGSFVLDLIKKAVGVN